MPCSRVAPRPSWLYFTKDAFAISRVGNSEGLSNQTLHAAIVRAHLSVSSGILDLFAVGVLCGGIALAAVAYRRSSAMLGVLVCAATGLLVSPISWIHHFVWIVPALVWLTVGTDRPAKGEWWALAGALAFVVIPPFRPGGTGMIWFLRRNAYVIITLAFLALVGCSGSGVAHQLGMSSSDGVGTSFHDSVGMVQNTPGPNGATSWIGVPAP